MDFQNQIYNILRIYSKDYDESLVLKGLNGKSKTHNIQRAFYTFLLYNILKEKIIPESQQQLILGTLNFMFLPEKQKLPLRLVGFFLNERTILFNVTQHITKKYIEDNATIRLMEEAKQQTLVLFGTDEANLYEINNLMTKIYE